MKHTRNRLAALIAPAVILLLSLPGCGDNGSGPVGNTLVKPTPGSYYIFRKLRYDTSGVLMPGPYRLDTFTIINTNISAWGVNGITSFWSTGIKDTGYLRYEPNGDLAVFYPVDTSHDGAKDMVKTTIYPFASHTPVQLSIDTGYDSGNNYTVHRDSVVYIGDETITLPAGNFQVSKVRDLHDHRGYSNKGVYESRVREIATIYFARSAGFFVTQTWEHEFIDTAGNLTSRRLFDRFELISYKVQ